MTLRKITSSFMKKTLALALLAGAVTAAGLHAARAQGVGASLGDKVERTLKAKDPSWRIQYKKKAGDNTRQMWGYGKDSVTVSIVEKASAQEAARALAASASSVNGARALKESGLGDEAYLVAADSTPNPERGEAAGVMFRKGGVLVYVNVRSHGGGGAANVAQLFAQHVAEQIQ